MTHATDDTPNETTQVYRRPILSANQAPEKCPGISASDWKAKSKKGFVCELSPELKKLTV